MTYIESTEDDAKIQGSICDGSRKTVTLEVQWTRSIFNYQLSWQENKLRSEGEEGAKLLMYRKASQVTSRTEHLV